VRPSPAAWAGLALSAACVAWVAHQADLPGLWQGLRGLHPGYVVAVNALFLVCFLLRTWRWRLLMAPVGPASFGALFSANLIGYAANNLLPARLGEAVRAYAGARLARAPLAGTAATIVVERMLDGPVMLGFVFAAAAWLGPEAQAGPLSAAYLRAAGAGLLLAYLALAALLAAVSRWPGRLAPALARPAARLSPRLGVRVRRTLYEFAAGLVILRRRRVLGLLLLLSVAVRLPLVAMHLVFLPAVGLPPSLEMGVLAFVGSSLASTLPSAPGYLGTFQVGSYWALVLAGAPSGPAMAYAVLYWAVQYFPLAAAGLAEALRRGLGPGSWRRAGLPRPRFTPPA
jgi:hypothetical protein